MSALLDLCAEARDLRATAESEFRKAIVRARAGRHTLSDIGRAAGLTKAGVAYILNRERERGTT